MTVGGIRAEQMDPADMAWLHMDRPTNLMVVNTVLWFDAPVEQASVLQLFEERVVSRFRRFRQRAADPALTLAPVGGAGVGRRRWLRACGSREPDAAAGAGGPKGIAANRQRPGGAAAAER
jgi:hypothetical protein